MSISTHMQRIATSVVLVALVAACIAYGGWAVFAAVLVIGSLGLWEFYGLFWPGRENVLSQALGILFGGALVLAVFLGRPGAALAVLLIAFWAANIAFLITFSRKPETTGHDGYARAMVLVGGLMYLPMLLQFFFGLSPVETVLVILCTLASDTGAYYAGTWFGNTKIWPTVSPKKTWKGSFGGLALCLCVCLGMGAAWGTADWWLFAPLGLALNLAAQFGDFFESALKRSLGIKDSGSLLPGHGGILDRIDGLLFALPVYAGARELVLFF